MRLNGEQYTGKPSAPAERKGGSVHVCPLSAVPQTVSTSKALRLLTCLQDEVFVERPELIRPENHLRLRIHDIAEPMPGFIAPDPTHITELIDLAHAWGGDGPIVVHCWAGISRSTAAAFTMLCTINPDVPESLIAQRLRDASATAYPNRLMIRLADEALGRKGRMVHAVESIGRGLPAAEAVPFFLPAEFGA